MTWAREVLLYRDSRDPKVAKAGVVVKTGRKWNVQVAVLDAESRLRHKELVGVMAQGRAWGCSQHHLATGSVKGRRSAGRYRRRSGLPWRKEGRAEQQGAWTRWEHAMDRKVTWADLWQSETHRISFLVRAVYDVLPSPANLFTWGKVETPKRPSVFRKGHPGTHSELLPKSAQPGPVHLASQPGAEADCRSHQQKDQ